MLIVTFNSLRLVLLWLLRDDGVVLIEDEEGKTFHENLILFEGGRGKLRKCLCIRFRELVLRKLSFGVPSMAQRILRIALRDPRKITLADN